MTGRIHHASCGCRRPDGMAVPDDAILGGAVCDVEGGAPAQGRTPRQGMITRGIAGAMIVLVRGYQLVISPYLPPRCRHLPTCSAYAIEAVQLHGPVHGAWLALRRVLRCHPWGTSGFDPAPPRPGPGAASGAGKSGEADA